MKAEKPSRAAIKGPLWALPFVGAVDAVAICFAAVPNSMHPKP